jgi:hypothetical protein
MAVAREAGRVAVGEAGVHSARLEPVERIPHRPQLLGHRPAHHNALACPARPYPGSVGWQTQGPDQDSWGDGVTQAASRAADPAIAYRAPYHPRSRAILPDDLATAHATILAGRTARHAIVRVPAGERTRTEVQSG